MSKHKNLIIIGVVAVTLIVVIVILSTPNKGNNSAVKQISPTVTPTYVYKKSDSGALLISRTPDQQKALDELATLRSKTPVDTGKFIINYDWKLVTFTVKTKDKLTKQSELQDWLRQYGYDLIPVEDFKFIQ